MDRPHLSREEVRGGHRFPVRGQECAPRKRPLGDRTDTVGAQDRRDGRSGDLMPEVLERALDPAVAPRGILPRHPDGELSNLAHDSRASRTPSHRGPFLSNQRAVPSEDRVGCDARRHLAYDPAPQPLSLGRETAALPVGQPQPSPAQVLLEDAVLFPYVLDHLKLVPIYPAC